MFTLVAIMCQLWRHITPNWGRIYATHVKSLSSWVRLLAVRSHFFFLKNTCNCQKISKIKVAGNGFHTFQALILWWINTSTTLCTPKDAISALRRVSFTSSIAAVVKQCKQARREVRRVPPLSERVSSTPTNFPQKDSGSLRHEHWLESVFLQYHWPQIW